MEFNPYLSFDGNCAEAMEAYAEILGGEVTMITRFKESPMAGDVSEEHRDKVMHAQIETGSGTLMGSDNVWGDYKPPHGIWISVQIEDVGEAKRVFDALSEGGNITMKFEETFWAAGFGMAIDRFGIPWLVNCNKPEA